MSSSQDPNFHSRRQRRLSLFLLLAIPLAFVWLAVAALDAAADSSNQRRPAATITVDSVGDISKCDPVECTLRGAILLANSTPGADTIDFDLPASSTITLTTRLPIITDTLTIDGSAVAGLSISGEGNSRILEVGSGKIATITNLTLTNGDDVARAGAIMNNTGAQLTVNNVNFIDNTSTNRAGAIYNDAGTLTIQQSNFVSNTADNRGGAIYNDAGTLTISNSSFISSTAGARGGAIYNAGVASGILTVDGATFTANKAVGGDGGGAIYNAATLTVTGSVFEDNTTSTTSGGGGGIRNDLSSTLVVANSSFSGNTAYEAGGAVRNSGALTVTGSTFASNTVISTTRGGGAIYASDFTTLLVGNSTFSANSAGEGGAIRNSGVFTLVNSTFSANAASVSGGGIYNSSSGILNYSNTIVANSQGGGDCISPGAIPTNTNNLVEDNSCSPAFSGDPNLGPLQNNGGPTLTFALLPGSPAVNNGDNAACAASPINNLDQRGETRPQATTCDIGAYEVVAVTGLSASSDSPTILGQPTNLTATVTAGESVTYAWDFGDGNSGSGANTSHTYGATGTYTAVVTATNAANSQSANTVVQVDELITGLTATNDGPTDLGSSTKLTATVTTGSGVITFDWDFGDGTSGSGQFANHTYAAPGVYTAVVTATNSVSQQTASTQVQVEAPITGLAASNDGPTALGLSTQLTATITTGSNVTYAWDFGDGSSGSGANPTHTYVATGTYTAVVTATNAVSQQTASTQVQVQALIGGLAATNDGPTVLGQSTHLTATITAGNGVTYEWDLGDGNMASGPNVTHTYAAPGSYTAVVTATNAFDQKTASTVVKVDVPIAGLAASNDGPTVLGDNTQLTASITGGTNVTYSWNLGDGSTASGATVTHKYAAAGSYTAVVTATNSLGQTTAQTVVVVKEGKLLLYLPLTSK